jgi:hypothetical protein
MVHFKNLKVITKICVGLVWIEVWVHNGAQGPQGSSSHVFIYFIYWWCIQTMCSHAPPLPTHSFPHQKRKRPPKELKYITSPPTPSQWVGPTCYITHHMCCIYSSTSLGVWSVVMGFGIFFTTKGRWEKSFNKITIERERKRERLQEVKEFCCFCSTGSSSSSSIPSSLGIPLATTHPKSADKRKWRKVGSGSIHSVAAGVWVDVESRGATQAKKRKEKGECKCTGYGEKKVRTLSKELS